jgi:hypothetical protein
MNSSAWAQGDALGLQIPANAAALRESGEAFLTAAFRATGALAEDNQVVRITRFEESNIGGTGRKVFLSVAYEKPSPSLHTELFVKFSRDFDDPIRDRSKDLMELEVRFALLSRTPGFPIAVPACLFADYEHASGTGILITQCIAFGAGRIEPAYEKCFDYELPQPVEHYRALITALGRLAGTHKGGRLAANIARQFPFDADKVATNDRIPYNAERLQNKVRRLLDFADRFPQLLPANVVSPAFLSRFAEDAVRYLQHELSIKRFLHNKPEFIALCHWNANIDNGWFWRNADGVLECGLLDWGRVNQMSVAQAIFGSLCAAETDLWDKHLDELLTLFANEFQSCGGPMLDPRELKLHVQLFTATMGLAWIMDAPSIIQAQVPTLAEVKDRFDPRFKVNALARVQLQLLTVFLNAWETQDFGAILDRFLGKDSAS